jgi:hypothetical protein
MAKEKQRVEAVERQLLRDIQKLTSRQFVYEDLWCGMVPFDGKLTELLLRPLPSTVWRRTCASSAMTMAWAMPVINGKKQTTIDKELER